MSDVIDPFGEYTVQEAAQFLDASESTLYRWLRSGKLGWTRFEADGPRVTLGVYIEAALEALWAEAVAHMTGEPVIAEDGR